MRGDAFSRQEAMAEHESGRARLPNDLEVFTKVLAVGQCKHFTTPTRLPSRGLRVAAVF
jgi:hypothetical protein